MVLHPVQPKTDAAVHPVPEERGDGERSKRAGEGCVQHGHLLPDGVGRNPPHARGSVVDDVEPHWNLDEKVGRDAVAVA